MAAQREVLREFLMQLGFQVDDVGARRFVSSILGVSKVAATSTAVIAGLAAGAEALVQTFASGFEKLYYASQRTKSSVESLQAVRFGFEQIGLTADGALQTVESFTRIMRTNPGMSSLLRGLGVDTRGKDTVQQLYSLVDRLSKMPHFIGANWAQRFGIDEQTFLMMKENLPALLEADKKRREINKDSGLDTQKAAEAAREYMNVLRELWSQLENVWRILSVKLLPYFREFAGAMNEALKDLATWVNGLNGLSLGTFSGDLHDILVDLRALAEMFTSGDANWVNSLFWALKGAGLQALHVFTDLVDAVLRIAHGDFTGAFSKMKQAAKDLIFSREGIGIDVGLGNGAQPGSPAPSGTPGRGGSQVALDRRGQIAQFKEMARAMARTYGIPANIFSAMIGHESGWNPEAVSSAGAIGLAQLMPNTAKEVGTNNLEDPEESLRGGAIYLAKQFRRFGNWNDALSAYNAGAGNLKAGRGYAETVLSRAGEGGGGVQVSQTNVFHMGGADPEAGARAVGREMTRINQDLLRNRTAGTR